MSTETKHQYQSCKNSKYSKQFLQQIKIIRAQSTNCHVQFIIHVPQFSIHGTTGKRFAAVASQSVNVRAFDFGFSDLVVEMMIAGDLHVISALEDAVARSKVN